MSANNIRLSAPFHILAALAVGAAAAAGCGAALASLMAARGLGPSAAWPLATAAVCAGCLAGGWLLALLQKSRGLLWGLALGAAYALALLAVQTANGGVPDGAQLARLGLMLLAGGAGGRLGSLSAGPKRRR